MKRALGAMVFVMVVGGAGTTMADVVMPPPASCPPGATPAQGHAGPHCRPEADCTGDAQCAGGRCAAVDHCIESRQCGGWSAGNPACRVEHVAGDCGAGRTC